ncbi:MAG: TIGR03862 family flavoprotein, partial [Burkholderiales bacterium]
MAARLGSESAARLDRLPNAVVRVAIVGGGPAGLMAAEVLADAGLRVDLYDAMPTLGRKFLLAGKGGLNLTHSEAVEAFVDRYGERRSWLAPMLARFGAAELRAWAQGLGIGTFIGSSGRVFPVDLKAAPLLRAWLHRLRHQGVSFHMRHRWLGWADSGAAAAPGELVFQRPQGALTVRADAVVLALGGASWARLGSDGAWVPWLQSQGVELAPLRPSNCGFDAAHVDAQGDIQPGWSEHFRSRHAGAPLKNVALACVGPGGLKFKQAGEFVITSEGVEGSLVYAASAPLRTAIDVDGQAVAHLDLLPGRSAAWVAGEVARPRGARSLATHLKSRLGLDSVKAALLYELLPREAIADAQRLAAAIKSLPLTL